MSRSMVLLTWGNSNPRAAKTATGLLRFCADECVAVLDPEHAGKSAADVLQVGEGIPIVGSLQDVSKADTLVIGIALPGGQIPPAWRPVLLEAIERGMDILSGMHEFLSDDPELSAAAQQHDVKITDVRKNDFRQIAQRPPLNPDCLRLHTVGHDCSVGKMLVSLAVARGLQQRQLDAHFVATGQTGIMISGSGLPIDCVVSDFVNGAAEQLVVDNQHHDILVIEGQGSLVHPAYSAVTLGLLHGCQPQGLIFVFEAGRQTAVGLDHVRLPDLAQQTTLFESMASLYQPCQTVAIAMNGRHLDSQAAAEAARKVESELELPVVDVVRDGPQRLLDAVQDFHRSGSWRG